MNFKGCIRENRDDGYLRYILPVINCYSGSQYKPEGEKK